MVGAEQQGGVLVRLANLAAALHNWSSSRSGARGSPRVGFPRFTGRRARLSCRFTTGAEPRASARPPCPGSAAGGTSRSPSSCPTTNPHRVLMGGSSVWTSGSSPSRCCPPDRSCPTRATSAARCERCAAPGGRRRGGVARTGAPAPWRRTGGAKPRSGSRRCTACGSSAPATFMVWYAPEPSGAPPGAGAQERTWLSMPALPLTGPPASAQPGDRPSESDGDCRLRDAPRHQAPQLR